MRVWIARTGIRCEAKIDMSCQTREGLNPTQSLLAVHGHGREHESPRWRRKMLCNAKEIILRSQCAMTQRKAERTRNRSSSTPWVPSRASPEAPH